MTEPIETHNTYEFHLSPCGEGIEIWADEEKWVTTWDSGCHQVGDFFHLEALQNLLREMQKACLFEFAVIGATDDNRERIRYLVLKLEELNRSFAIPDEIMETLREAIK